MKTSYIIFTLILLISGLISNAQSGEVARLKKELASANERANTAEANAHLALEDSRRYQMVAEQARMQAERAEAAAKRARYIAQAKAMAVKSIELGADPEQEALVALLAYKFNTQYGGNSNDQDIYNGLYTAMVRNHDNLAQSQEGPSGVPMLISDSRFGEIFSVDPDGRILRWTPGEAGWKSESISDKHKSPINTLALSPDGDWLAAGSNVVELYDLKNPDKAPQKVSGFSMIKRLLFTPNGEVYVLEQGGGIKFTDFKMVREVIKPREHINVLEISHDGSKLAGAGSSGVLYVWDIANAFDEKVVFKNTNEITAVAFESKDRRLVIGDDKGQVKIIVVYSDLPPLILTGHTSAIERLSFDPTSKQLASAGRDHTIRLWNWNNLFFQPIVIKDETQEIWSSNIVFSPKGDQLMVIFKDKTEKQWIHSWPLNASTMATSLCQYSKRNMTKEEWTNFVGGDLPYEKTCDNFPENNK